MSSQGSDFSSNASESLKRLPLSLNLEKVNEAFSILGVSRLSKTQAGDADLVKAKIEELTKNVQDMLRVVIEKPAPEVVLEQFRINFKNMDKGDQYRVLTSMPLNSPIQFLKENFGVTEHQARRAKLLQGEKGLLSTPDPKAGKRIPEELVKKVKQFYESDKISRQMPGRKDYVTIKINGVKEHVQKRLILVTEHEAFLFFREENPDVKLGFSKFAEARPRHVVLPGASGTHNVCVCSYHQNPKLMIANSKISSQCEFKTIVHRDRDGDSDGDNFDGEIKYQHLVARLMCNPPQIACWMGECKECKDTDKFEDDLLKIFEGLEIENITFKQWVSTDRTELETVTQNVEDFVKGLIEKLQVLKVHMFINNQQTKFFYNFKESLGDGVVLAVGDFSENYSFVYQDAVQGVHWSNTQVTLHPWMCYFKQDGVLKTFSVLFISDCLTHNTVAVFSFQKVLIRLLKEKLNLVKILYFSDGCSKQYKNKKNFLNLANHKIDFGVAADWAFSATSHGKGPWDGLAGSVKRQAALESLKRPEENQIQTPLQFYEFAKTNFKKVQVEFVGQAEIDKNEEDLLERFKLAKLVKGTLKLHMFSTIDGDSKKLEVKKFAYSVDKKVAKVSK